MVIRDSDDPARDSFMSRKEVAALPQDDREAAWQQHMIALECYLARLESISSITEDDW